MVVMLITKLAGCHVLPQGIFPSQGLNPRLLCCLLHWQVGSLPAEPLRKPYLYLDPLIVGEENVQTAGLCHRFLVLGVSGEAGGLAVPLLPSVADAAGRGILAVQGTLKSLLHSCLENA